ncbi:MAG TPA: hypothetical protein EYN60_00270, partial [Nitrospirales bacterium]|nr:hypothetical protein [Nitrospirales bacterium]
MEKINHGSQSVKNIGRYGVVGLVAASVILALSGVAFAAAVAYITNGPNVLVIGDVRNVAVIDTI